MSDARTSARTARTDQDFDVRDLGERLAVLEDKVEKMRQSLMENDSITAVDYGKDPYAS